MRQAKIRLRHLCFRFLVLLGEIHGMHNAYNAENGRCLSDVINGGNGKVVIFDVAVSVPSRRLYIIGPHKKLWIVPEAPSLQKDTVSFPRYFVRGRNEIREGSYCTYSCPLEQFAARKRPDDCTPPLHSAMDFLNDPIENVNVALCDIPVRIMSQLLIGVRVTVSLSFRSFGDGDIFIADLPVCAPPPASNPIPYVSLCCIIRNEARYLVEWIEYSRMIGVEHFYLYDHASDDNTLEVLAPYISAGIATWHNWSFPGYPQREAHSHCTHKYAHTTKWLGLFDVDEFIVPVKVDTIIPILQYFGSDQVVLRLSAAMFGTSGHIERPLGLVIASYTMRNITTHWPNNPQHKVFFRPGDNYVLLPSIHAVDIVSESTVQVDLHEHDLYYNHYRTKSVKDHQDDPLRSKMVITEAMEVEDTSLRDRFIPALQTRLYSSEGGRHPEQLSRGSNADQSNSSARNGSGESGGIAGATLAVASTLAQAWRGRYEECPRLAHALAEILTRDRRVLDIECGSGFYTSALRLLGYDVTGFESEGSVAQLLGDVGVRELDLWEPLGNECSLGGKGHVICLALEEVRWPDRLGILLENIAICADGLVVVNWPHAASRQPLFEAMLVHGGLVVNSTLSAKIQDLVNVARSVTQKYLQHGVAVSQCLGSSQIAVFTGADGLSRLLDLVPTEPENTFKASIVSPMEGDLIVQTVRVQNQGIWLNLLFDAYPPGISCAAVYFDGKISARTCRSATLIPIPKGRDGAGMHVIVTVGLAISSSGQLLLGGRESVTVWLDPPPPLLPPPVFAPNQPLDHTETVSAYTKQHVTDDHDRGGHPHRFQSPSQDDGESAFFRGSRDDRGCTVCAVTEYRPQCASGPSTDRGDGRPEEAADAGGRCDGSLQPYHVTLSGLRRMAYTLSLGVWEEEAAAWEWSFLAGESGRHSLLVLLPSGSGLRGGVQRFAVMSRDAGTHGCTGNVSLVVTEPRPPSTDTEGRSEPVSGSSGAGSVFCTTPAVTLDGLLPRFVWPASRFVWPVSGTPASLLRQTTGGYRLEQLRVAGDGAVSFRLMRVDQPPRTVDWIYVRAVGPAIAVGRVSYHGEGEYTAALALPLGGVYVIQVVRAWGGLPERVVGSGVGEAEADDAMLGHAGARADLVGALLSPHSVAGHVLVPASSPAFAQRPPCDARGGLRQGVWVRSDGPWESRGPPTSGTGKQQQEATRAATTRAGRQQQQESTDGDRDADGDGEPMIDRCPLVQGGWNWQPYECKQVCSAGLWVMLCSKAGKRWTVTDVRKDMSAAAEKIALFRRWL
jgi:hypothetical protein